MSGAATVHQPATRVLLIEDDRAQARLIQHMLSRSTPPFEIEWVDRLAAGLDRLRAASFDIVVVDLGLPDSEGLATFDAVRETEPLIPAVVMTGTDREEIAIEAVRRGAQDYIVKGCHTGPMIARSLQYAIERKRLEEQLLQSQKMEAIGSLAGGIAHEFNNLLQAIIGYTRFAVDGLPVDDERRADLDKALSAANQAADLTQQLLNFSRPHRGARASIDVSELISEVAELMIPLLGKHMELNVEASPEPLVVVADRRMLQQALMNLCINARDAMPSGGLLRIAVGKVCSAEDGAAWPSGLKPGNYVSIAVHDTGCGIPGELRERVIEPFFTTKPPGKGTGLGLAMVYSMVQEHRGHLRIDSEVEAGSSVVIYLPLVERLEESEQAGESPTNRLALVPA